MAHSTNRRWLLASRPRGMATVANFRLQEEPVRAPQSGEVLCRTVYLSVDPYMRGRMNEGRSYADPAKLDSVMVGGTVSQVIESQSSSFKPGDFVLGYFGWQEYGVSAANHLTKLDLPADLLPAALGALGMPGLTAWYGLLEIGKPEAGQTVVVSGGAGAVGSVVGQIAKIRGCRVLGIAGSDRKTDWLTGSLGFDHASNYKSAADLSTEIGSSCPDGVDIYFDNVGGAVTEAVLPHLNTFGRIVVCGQISGYNLVQPLPATSILPLLLTRRATARGFIVGDHSEFFPRALADLRGWVEDGSLKHEETIVEGLENAPTAFLGLFDGSNIGKQLVKVSNPE
ncbi:MAG TPA: NADP-dependent oxidoreductase [Spirochaetia bacterium]|nr:NADP-dependent oxidoreductase [Spirochaetia bacterium]